MKKILLSDELHYYRANLHCHSTISDGRKTPEELKAFYQAQGYSAIAFTDHEVLIPHNDLTDDSFVALNGYELGVNDVGSSYMALHCCHLCLIALDPEPKNDVCYHRTKYLGCGNSPKYHDKVQFDPAQPDFERVYTPEGVNEMIARGRRGGFFVTYNHPAWSLEDYPIYMAYHGMNAMEICNYSAVKDGFDEYDGHVYNDMLRGGERLYCVATDDNHNVDSTGDPAASDSFGGYVMIGAPKLGYRELTQALENGMFYSVSTLTGHTGPEIHSVTYEDGTVELHSSPVRRITIDTGLRSTHAVFAPEGTTVDHATFQLNNNEPWFRLIVEDAAGAKAYTNAFFTDTLQD